MTSAEPYRPASPLARSIEAAHDCGWSTLPLAPPGALDWEGKPLAGAGKVPAEFYRGYWRRLKGWQMHGQWHVNVRTDGSIIDRGEPLRMGEIGRERWASMPSANLGIAVDRRFFCIDIDDADPSVRFAVRSMADAECAPGSLIGKSGRIGETLFVALSEPGTAKNMRLGRRDRSGGIDILAEGRQTVVPHSIHPTTHRPYVYTTDGTCEDTAVEQLPQLKSSFEAFIVSLAQALVPFGYAPAGKRAQNPSNRFDSSEVAYKIIAGDSVGPEWVRFDGALDEQTRRRLEGLFRQQIRRVSEAQTGARHNVLLAASRLLAGYLRYRAYSPEETVAALYAASIANGHASEDGDAVVYAAIRDGMKNGFDRPLVLEAPKR